MACHRPLYQMAKKLLNTGFVHMRSVAEPEAVLPKEDVDLVHNSSLRLPEGLVDPDVRGCMRACACARRCR